MAMMKGTSVCNLRKLFKEINSELEMRFLDKLTPDCRELYFYVLPSSMSPVEKQVKLYDAAASVLYPDDPFPLKRLGQELSSRSYSGVYKLFLRIPTTNYIIGKVAQIWSTYFDTGKMNVEHADKNNADVVLRFFPDLPKSLLQYTCGHTQSLLSSAGARNVNITIVDNNPNEWRWKISWH